MFFYVATDEDSGNIVRNVFAETKISLQPSIVVNMCRHQIAGEEEDKTYNANEIQHGLTDVIPLLVFIVLVVAGFIVGIIAIGAGNPESLLYGTDYNGVTCGSANNHLPKCPYGMQCDMKSQLIPSRMTTISFVKRQRRPGGSLALKLGCVSACPKAKTWTCTDAILRKKWRRAQIHRRLITTGQLSPTNTNMVVA